MATILSFGTSFVLCVNVLPLLVYEPLTHTASVPLCTTVRLRMETVVVI